MSFKRLEPEDFLISADSIAAGAWTGNVPNLSNFYTSSVQVSSTSGNYYLNIFQTGSTLTEARVQFNIAFGDSEGSGSVLYDAGIDGKSYTSTVFGQWQNIVLGDENNNFIFGGVTPTIQSFYAIAVERANYKGSIFPGTLNLQLSGSTTSALTLTDNSNDVSTVVFNEAGRVFQIVSGSGGNAVGSTVSPTDAVAPGMTASGSYGLFLPDIGAILLNPAALDLPVSDGTNGGGILLTTLYNSNTADNNNNLLYNAISRSGNFTLNSQENVTSDYVFVRARNSEFNYSENPSFISGSTGEVLYNSFINSPQTFLTTIGMYNDSNELLAVAKLSKPLIKDFTKEALVRVKLDF
tara:strand:+ start:66 stop:1121 length:1056 start_codon:yes stop_codon:yes gene_type:complete